MKNHWLVLWSLWAARLVRQPTLPVKVEGGWLRGFISPAGTHKSYLAIPYATHPERFQSPGPAPSWRGVFEAIEENVKCPQRIGRRIPIGQEDCLILNIHTPINATSTTSYAVMVFIHGGGFYDGSGTPIMYGPDYLINKGVILVTINYRLNIQGYACLRIKEAPGNAGLKDQVAALKWVRKNIKAFGGDPDNVTIFGESAGSASVSLHILSPMSKGLFHKAIMQSGSSLSSWVIQFKPVYMASLLTKAMQYSTEDPKEIYDVLRKKSDTQLVITRVPRKNGNVIISELLYSPCVEENIDEEVPFLTDLPFDKLSKGEYNMVPTIIGSCSEEGLLFAALENATTLPEIEFVKTLPKNLHVPTDAEKEEIGENLRKFYMGDNAISQDTLANLSRLHGEVFITHPVLEETELYVKTSDKPVYSYVFKYTGWRNIIRLTFDKALKGVYGATHAEDIFYMFSQIFLPTLLEHEMINRLTTMWTNFAKYGDPTPMTSELLPMRWLPVDKLNPKSLVIDEEFSHAPLWSTDSLKYLRQVYSKYRRKND